ncbi:MAG: type II toxin-antitoxin system ParD family antitoxin [Lentisphaerae bacterium]|nr:type II toxin-antitoxin system ParD family antitoxin [Lentisphaerota bacterium]
MTVTVSLTPQLEEELNIRVKSGQYASASEVVREALRLLSHIERIRNAQLAQIEKEIAVGAKQFETGQFSRFTDETVDDIRAEGMKRLRNRQDA